MWRERIWGRFFFFSLASPRVRFLHHFIGRNFLFFSFQLLGVQENQINLVWIFISLSMYFYFFIFFIVIFRKIKH
jgi:hypothetical protein